METASRYVARLYGGGGEEGDGRRGEEERKEGKGGGREGEREGGEGMDKMLKYRGIFDNDVEIA